jgi:hypothetical protein
MEQEKLPQTLVAGMIPAIFFRAGCAFGEKMPVISWIAPAGKRTIAVPSSGSGLGAALLKKMRRIPQYRWKQEAGTNI